MTGRALQSEAPFLCYRFAERRALAKQGEVVGGGSWSTPRFEWIPSPYVLGVFADLPATPVILEWFWTSGSADFQTYFASFRAHFRAVTMSQLVRTFITVHNSYYRVTTHT